MKRIVYNLGLLALLGVGVLVNAQENAGRVGINTKNNPQATLEVKPSVENAKANATTNEGIIAPKLSKERIAKIANPVEGTLVYVTNTTYSGNEVAVAKIDDKGYYYFDGTEWVKAKGGTTTGVSDNIYTADGALSADRTVSMNGKNLVFNGGYIGIGNSLPTTAIHVQGSDYTNSSITLERNYASIGASATLEFNKSRGANTAKTAVVNRDALGSLMFRAYNGTSFINSAQILSRVDTDGNIENAQAIPSSLFFSTTNDGEEDKSIKMTLNKDGKLGVGMPSRPLYSLSVSTPHTGLNYTKTDGIFLLNKLTLNEKAGIRSIGGVEISSDFEGNFPSSGVIAFKVSNQEHMRVTSDGNVGIGTTTPSEKLEVVGSIKSTALAESGGGNRPVYADENGKLVIGTATAGGSTTNGAVIYNVRELKGSDLKILPTDYFLIRNEDNSATLKFPSDAPDGRKVCIFSNIPSLSKNSITLSPQPKGPYGATLYANMGLCYISYRGEWYGLEGGQ